MPYLRIESVWFLFLFLITYCNETRSSVEKQNLAPVPLFKDGDLILSAMFPITVQNVTTTGKRACVYFPLGIILFEAFHYAVEKVNNESILQGMTLGYDVRDTCSRVDKSVKIALDVHQLMENESAVATLANNSELKTNKHIAVIGAGKSELSITVNDILSAFGIPQVGYASSSKILSDKYRFSTFSRTIPTDTLQAKVIVDIFKQFGWTYAMLIYSDDNYGRPLYSSLLHYSEKEGICFAGIEKLPSSSVTDKELSDVVEQLKKHNTAGVVVVFLNDINSERLINVARNKNMSKKIWIFTATWYNVPNIFVENEAFLEGSIGVVDENMDVQNFYFYLTSRADKWMDRLHVNILHAKKIEKNGDIKPSGHDVDMNLEFRILTKVPYVINAVLAVVNAINKFCAERFPASSSHCQEEIRPNSILPYLRNTSFKGMNNHQVFLDNNGDTINNNIDLYSFQRSFTGESHVHVGVYNGEEDNLTLFLHKFNWSKNIPTLSRCSLPCSKGLHKVVSVMKPCCWECQPCPLGTYSNQTNSVSCKTCSSGTKPTRNQSGCEIITYDYMRWNDPWAIVISFSAVMSSLIAFVFFFIFIYFRNTPVVRAFDCEFSLLLLLSMAVGLALPIMYPGEPNDFRCRLQDILPAVIYSLTLSTIIAKNEENCHNL